MKKLILEAIGYWFLAMAQDERDFLTPSLPDDLREYLNNFKKV